MIYKQRASSLGTLMTQPATKRDREAGLLGKTAQSMVKDWYREKLYGRRKDVYSKYLEKGTTKEQDNLFFVGEALDLGLITDTNKLMYEDDYFRGTPDLILTDLDMVVDIKSSWDFSTFPLFEGEGQSKLYYYQMQCYMHLTGMRHGKLVYVLGNTPDGLVDREIYYKLKDASASGQTFTKEEEEAIRQGIRDYHNYDALPNSLRVKVIQYAYDEFEMEKAVEQVEKARTFLKSIQL